ncbi:MAG: DUF6512 family protein [Marinilabiliales bacterium]|nr:DUF6512 family protein [Marinilabiliales bacterium]
MKNKVLLWEIGGFFFIGLVGASLHFTYELSDFSSNVVAFFSAVNESTWEHLKMTFFPGLVFALVEYTYIRGKVNNYLDRQDRQPVPHAAGHRGGMAPLRPGGRAEHIPSGP